ncbi:hypothetical protein N9L68_06845 [bacterium]|nr:hypothetical protein [bacterium]
MGNWDEDKVEHILGGCAERTEYHNTRTKEGNHVEYATSTHLVVGDIASVYHILHADDSSLPNPMIINNRHPCLCKWVSPQRPSLVSCTIITQMGSLFIFKQRNAKSRYLRIPLAASSRYPPLGIDSVSSQELSGPESPHTRYSVGS